MYNKISSLMSYRNNLYLRNNDILNNKILNSNVLNNKKTVTKSVEKYFSGGLEELKFKNNVLDIKNGVNYKAKTLMSGYSEIVLKNNRAYRLFDEIYPNIDNTEVFSEQEVTDIGRTNQLIGILAGDYPFDEKLNLIRIFYPHTMELKTRLESLGAVSGQMIEFNGCPEKLLFETNGWLYTQDELNNLRNAYNRRNFLELGYTCDSKFIIDGNEYKPDSTGHLNIPEGTICTPTRVKIIK